MDLYKIRSRLGMGESIYDIPLRVTFYARVSTDKDEQLNSLENQIMYFKDFISKNDNWTYVDGYIDEGISGTSTLKREKFLEMIRDGKNGKFDLILTKEISRFSRSTLDSIKYTQELLEHNVGVLFQSDNINTILPDSELRLTIMSSVAQEEVRKLSERVKFGMKRSVEKGRVLGNSVITGYKKDDGKLVVIPEEAEYVKYLFETYAEGEVGLEKIAHNLFDMGLKTKKGDYVHSTTLRRMITNPKYKGFYCTNTVQILDYKNKKQKRLPMSEWKIWDSEGEIPAIVTPEIWQKANDVLSGRRSNYLDSVSDKRSFVKKYAYGGLLICKDHNVTFRRLTSSNKNVVWMCGHYQRHGLKGCKSPRLVESELDSIFKNLLNDLIKDKEKIVSHLSKIYEQSSSKIDYDLEIKKIEEKVIDLGLSKDKLLSLCVKELISESEFSERNNEFNEQIKKLDEKISNLEFERNQSKIKMNDINKISKAILKEFDSDTSFKDLMQLLIEKIVVSKVDGDRKDIMLEVHVKLTNDKINIHNGIIQLGNENLSCSHDENYDGDCCY